MKDIDEEKEVVKKNQQVSRGERYATRRGEVVQIESPVKPTIEKLS